MPIKKILLTTLLLIGLSFYALYAQQDSRYDAGMNLPFNEKAGDVNPQTGSITLSADDLSLPGRAGFNFSFGRIWSMNQSNVFNMYRDPADGRNRLSSETIEKYNRIGIGWNSNIPYIYKDNSSGTEVISLFYGGNVYEIDSSGMNINNPNKSNILGYDLTDMRVYSRMAGQSVAYSDLTGDFTQLSSLYSVNDKPVDRSKYVLILKTNEKYWFRDDGRLMMQEDKTGLNKIWYLYGNGDDAGVGVRANDYSPLRLAIDTVGRKVRFQYDENHNLSSIEWDVEIGVKNADGTRGKNTETRRVMYQYESAEKYASINGLKSNVIGYATPYVLVSVTDPMGFVTRYDYKDGEAEFTYDSSKSVSKNVYLLLTSVASVFTKEENTEKYKNKRGFEYDIPAKGLYTRWFYKGWMKYYKISRESVQDRNGRTLNDTRYIYHDNGESGNFNQYTAVIERGNTKTTYTYSLSDDKNKNQVLDTLLVETADGFKQLSDYVYNSDRTKALEEVFKQGSFAYREKFQYDSKGNLKRHEDRMGLVTIKEYDDKFSIPLKNTVQVSVDGTLKNYESEVKINSLGQPLKEILYLEQKDGAKKAVEAATYTYDNWGNVTDKKDALGNVAHTVFDTLYHCYPVKVWSEVSIASWANGTVHDNWQTDPAGQKKVRIRSWKVFNSDGSLWLEIDNEGFAKEHYYDKNGQETEVVNPDLDDERAFAKPIDAANPQNDFDNFMESAFVGSFLDSRQNNPGARMQIDYQNDYVKTEADIDAAKGEVKVTGKQGNGTGLVEKEIEYGADGEEYSVKQMAYDNLGRMITLTDPDASDDNVNITVNGAAYARHDKTWVVKYDDVGRKVKVLYPDTRDGKTDIKQTSYNDAENSTTTIDPEGRKVYERRDWNGNIVEVKAYGDSATRDDEVQTYTFEYDGLKRKVKFTDAKGIVTKYKYDERNLLVEQNFGENTGSDFMTYDDVGKLMKKTDRKGQIIVFAYDELGRNTRAVHYKSNDDYSNAKIDRTVDLCYDNRGNAVRIANENLIEHYIYDFGNRVIKLERRLKDAVIRTKAAGVYGGDGASQVFSFDYQYNDAGMVTQMKYPDGSIHQFKYDSALARLSGIDEGSAPATVNPFVTHLAYNRSGVVTKMDYANLTSQQWEFDNRKRIKEIKIANTTGLIEDLKYKLNGDGDILSINSNEYSYDGFDRIIGAKTLIPGNSDRLKRVKKYFGTTNIGDPIDGIPFDATADINKDGEVSGKDHLIVSRDNRDAAYDLENFTYDKNGNRTKLIQNGDEYTYEYGIQNRLLKVYKQTKGAAAKKIYIEYDYDANGNTVKRTIHKDNNKDDIIQFGYDTMNRVLSTTESTEGTEKKTEYRYDNAGNRFIKISGKETTVYLRHGQIAVAMDIEIKDDSTGDRGKVNRYVLSGDLLAGRITTEVKNDGSKAVKKSWYHLDHLNSTKCVTDEKGKLEVMYEYRAFGEELKKVGNGDAKYTYGGKELDDETNLYYFNARYYDATIGRFINVDPVQDGVNWYVYCNNNPLVFTDPTGLDAFTIIWQSKKDETGHSGIAIENYALKNGKYVKDGTLTYYDLWPQKPVGQLELQSGVTPNYNKRIINSLDEILKKDPSVSNQQGYVSENGEGRAPDNVVRLKTTYQQDQTMMKQADSLLKKNDKYNACYNNCSTFVQNVLKSILPNFDASQSLKTTAVLKMMGYKDASVVAPNNLHNEAASQKDATTLKGDKTVNAKPYLEYFK